MRPQNLMFQAGWVHPQIFCEPDVEPVVKKAEPLVPLNSEKSKESGAQGRNRTTDTAIFSRMLYQLSYLGLMTEGRGPPRHRRASARKRVGYSTGFAPVQRSRDRNPGNRFGSVGLVRRACECGQSFGGKRGGRTHSKCLPIFPAGRYVSRDPRRLSARPAARRE